MNLTTINVIRKPTGEANRRLLEFAAGLASRFGVMIRSDKVRLEPSAISVLDSLNPYLLERNYVAEWPGSKLTGGPTAIQLQYAANDITLGVLLAAADSLFDWVNPHLLEDLHMLRSDGSTLLGSIAQEEDAWMNLTEDEQRWLRSGPGSSLRPILDL